MSAATSQPAPGPAAAAPAVHAQTAAANGAAASTTTSGSGSNSGDLRRVKSGLSCAECRRSKLKCDRSFPCQSCIRRGCAAICPDGTLTATKGNKVLMAHAERLTQQVKAMSTRIKELEHALAMTQTGNAHPLLRDADPRDGAAILTELEGTFAAEMEEVSDAIGSLSIAMDGKTTYHGETASSEYLQNLIQESSAPAHLSNPKFLGLPPDIIELINAYPFGVRDHQASTEVFKMFVPPRDRTETVAAMFYTNASWLYDPVPRAEFDRLFRDPIYQAVDGFIPWKSIPAHNFSVFFMILATGLIFSPSQSAPILMEQYHALARAAFSLDSITRGASTTSVQALTLMIHYSYWTDRNGTEVRWLYNGLCVRIAQMIGLQRDSAGWHLDKDEVQRRRTTFWEFYTWDAWSSVITGRPPVLNISQADCRFPEDYDSVVNSQGQLEPGWHRWKWMYNVNCLTPSLQRTFSVRPPSYSSLLELDKRIRSFPLPEHLRAGSENGQGWSTDPFKAMVQHCATVLRESNLLYIHRSYFAQAIRESTDPLKHKYGQSVLAAYQSTRALVSSLRGAHAVHPALVGKIWWFWSAIYSSCVILGAVVVESPGCKLANSALADLDATIAFFELGSASSRSPRTLPMLRTFHTRAHEAYEDYRRQIQSGAGSVTTPPKDRSTLDSPDELEVLGGRKALIDKGGAARTASRDTYALRPSPPALTVTNAPPGPVPASANQAYFQQQQQQGPSLAPIVTEGLQLPHHTSAHQGYDYTWDTSPVSVSSAGPFAYPQSTARTTFDEPMRLIDDAQPMRLVEETQQRAPPLSAQQQAYADYAAFGGTQVAGPSHGFARQMGPDTGPPPGASQMGAQQPRPPGPAGMGYQEDIWQDFVQHLGMRVD